MLNRLDDFMANAHTYGIKLLVSIHSYNALAANADFYGQWYGTGDFYTDANAIGYFKGRIAHVLAHVNPHNGKPWSQSSEYIFAFEAQNEAMHDQVSCLAPFAQRGLLKLPRETQLRCNRGSVPWPKPSGTT